jgi:rhodanese-related sulfurtransferase
MNTIDRNELSEMLASPNPPVLLEALGEAYYEQGHLPGAIALPLDRVKAVAEQRLHDKSVRLVVYCASSTCKNSDVAARALVAMGYANVRVYRGGKADWSDAGLPLERGPERNSSQHEAASRVLSA